jgi:Family of unknown function (DUF6011)
MNYNNQHSIGRNSDAVSRHCSRCGLPLTDAASREHGVGPLCRKKNNDIFAKQIPADVATASAIMLSLKSSNFHSEIAGQFEVLKDSFLTKLQRLSRENSGQGIILSGADFRKIVDWFDIALSYPITYETKLNIIKLIDAVGYKRLAGVLKGDVCMSPAKLTIQDGFLVLEGKNNKAGYLAMRRVPEIVLPKYRGKPYKVPVRAAKKFLDVVEQFWPFNDFNDLLEAQIENMNKISIEETNTLQDIIVDNRPVAEIKHNIGLGFSVLTPWVGSNQEMFGMLDKFKAIESQNRKYDPASRTWSFKIQYLTQIKEIIEPRYRVVEQNNV